jgi:multiple sugar transport system substrate-binding protein
MLIGVFSFGVVTLNFIEVLTSPARTQVIKEIIADFEAKNPDIKINLISPPYEQADQRATLMLNTNQALDIIEVRDYTVKQFVNNGKLENLESYLARWEHNDTLTFVANQAARTVDDTAFIVPQFFFIKGLFVRTDVLEELGVNYIPKTMSELVELCIEITDPWIQGKVLGVQIL